MNEFGCFPEVEFELFVSSKVLIRIHCQLDMWKIGHIINLDRIMLKNCRSFTRISKRVTYSSRLFGLHVRCVSSVNKPVYPSPRDDELVNDEYYEVVENSAIAEMEEALQEKCPVGYTNRNLL